jgi:anti-sigma-K factor RskA
MAKIIPLQAREHQDLQNLLGWYAAGALEPDDRARVERHLAGCVRCRQLLAEESQLQSRLEDVSFEVDNDWARLRARIQGEAPRAARRTPSAAVGRWLAPPARPAWGWLLAAQFLLVLTVGVAVFTWSQPRYHVLSAPTPPSSGNVIVMFRPDTPEKDFREALRSGGARLVDGPTETGVYVLRVTPKTRPAAIAALRQRRSVAMAEPIDTGGPP